MAFAQHAHAGAHGIAIDEFTKNTPPGWVAHMEGYPFTAYQQRLTLWLRGLPQDGAAAMTHAMIASAVVGRLRGSCYRMAIELNIVVQGANGNFEEKSGIEALIHRGRDAELDANGIESRPRENTGLDFLMEEFKKAYAKLDVDDNLRTLDAFFDLSRGQESLMDYCTAWSKKYTKAHQLTGLAMNDIGKTHLFLKHAGLATRFIDDVMLKVDGDRSRFDDILGIVIRTAKQHQHTPQEDTSGGIWWDVRKGNPLAVKGRYGFKSFIKPSDKYLADYVSGLSDFNND